MRTGNGSLFNRNSNSLGAGAVGKEGWIVSTFQRNKQVLLRVDPLTEEPARGPDGLAIRVRCPCSLASHGARTDREEVLFSGRAQAAPNEPGELVIQIDNSSPYQAFAGYHNNPAATNKKIMRSVLAKDDMYFRTGDLLRRDADGHWYFADRLGDTFRWKSENVSTADVAEKLGQVVDEANVYGVLGACRLSSRCLSRPPLGSYVLTAAGRSYLAVPSHDGRAGCAAIPLSSGQQVDFAALSAHVARTLPKYAQPLFVRLVPACVLRFLSYLRRTASAHPPARAASSRPGRANSSRCSCATRASTRTLSRTRCGGSSRASGTRRSQRRTGRRSRRAKSSCSVLLSLSLCRISHPCSCHSIQFCQCKICLLRVLSVPQGPGLSARAAGRHPGRRPAPPSAARVLPRFRLSRPHPSLSRAQRG